LFAFPTARDCIQLWAICHPPSMNGKWQQNHLLRCLKLLDHYSSGSAKTESVPDLKTLHAKIGQLTLENDFLESALTKAGLLSARK
jgi:transposase